MALGAGVLHALHESMGSVQRLADLLHVLSKRPQHRSCTDIDRIFAATACCHALTQHGAEVQRDACYHARALSMRELESCIVPPESMVLVLAGRVQVCTADRDAFHSEIDTGIAEEQARKAAGAAPPGTGRLSEAEILTLFQSMDPSGSGRVLLTHLRAVVDHMGDGMKDLRARLATQTTESLDFRAFCAVIQPPAAFSAAAAAATPAAVPATVPIASPWEPLTPAAANNNIGGRNGAGGSSGGGGGGAAGGLPAQWVRPFAAGEHFGGGVLCLRGACVLDGVLLALEPSELLLVDRVAFEAAVAGPGFEAALLAKEALLRSVPRLASAVNMPGGAGRTSGGMGRTPSGTVETPGGTVGTLNETDEAPGRTEGTLGGTGGTSGGALDLRRLAAVAELWDGGRGAAVVRCGEAAEWLYIVVEGECQVAHESDLLHGFGARGGLDDPDDHCGAAEVSPGSLLERAAGAGVVATCSPGDVFGACTMWQAAGRHAVSVFVTSSTLVALRVERCHVEEVMPPTALKALLQPMEGSGGAGGQPPESAASVSAGGLCRANRVQRDTDDEPERHSQDSAALQEQTAAPAVLTPSPGSCDVISHEQPLADEIALATPVPAQATSSSTGVALQQVANTAAKQQQQQQQFLAAAHAFCTLQPRAPLAVTYAAPATSNRGQGADATGPPGNGTSINDPDAAVCDRQRDGAGASGTAGLRSVTDDTSEAPHRSSSEHATSESSSPTAAGRRQTGAFLSRSHPRSAASASLDRTPGLWGWSSPPAGPVHDIEHHETTGVHFMTLDPSFAAPPANMPPLLDLARMHQDMKWPLSPVSAVSAQAAQRLLQQQQLQQHTARSARRSPRRAARQVSPDPRMLTAPASPPPSSPPRTSSPLRSGHDMTLHQAMQALAATTVGCAASTAAATCCGRGPAAAAAAEAAEASAAAATGAPPSPRKITRWDSTSTRWTSQAICTNPGDGTQHQHRQQHQLQLHHTARMAASAPPSRQAVAGASLSEKIANLLSRTYEAGGTGSSGAGAWRGRGAGGRARTAVSAAGGGGGTHRRRVVAQLQDASFCDMALHDGETKALLRDMRMRERRLGILGLGTGISWSGQGRAGASGTPPRDCCGYSSAPGGHGGVAQHGSTAPGGSGALPLLLATSPQQGGRSRSSSLPPTGGQQQQQQEQHGGIQYRTGSPPGSPLTQYLGADHPARAGPAGGPPLPLHNLLPTAHSAPDTLRTAALAQPTSPHKPPSPRLNPQKGSPRPATHHSSTPSQPHQQSASHALLGHHDRAAGRLTSGQGPSSPLSWAQQQQKQQQQHTVDRPWSMLATRY